MIRSLRSTSRLGLALGLLLLFACRSETPPGDSSASSGADTPLGQDEEGADIDALRSMPYLGLAKGAASSSTRGVTYHDPTRAHPGYTFYGVRHLGLAVLIDAEGTVIRAWELGSGQLTRAVLLDDGDVLLLGRGAKRSIVRQDWDGNRIFEFELPVHHDVGFTPDGDLMVLAMRTRQVAARSDRVPVRDDVVLILDEEGKRKDSLSLYDAMRAADFEFTDVKPHPVENYVDLFHANSIQWMTHEHLVGRDPLYDPGHLLVSIRHQDTIAVFDWASKTMVWEWGRGEISGQHDARWLANGNLLVFDNGLGRRWSRIVELDPIAREIVWEYAAPKNRADFYTRGRGSNQRLPNGNTLICESDEGRAFEVTPEGHVVWEYMSPHFVGQRRATFVRCYRIESAVVDRLLADD